MLRVKMRVGISFFIMRLLSLGLDIVLTGIIIARAPDRFKPVSVGVFGKICRTKTTKTKLAVFRW